MTDPAATPAAAPLSESDAKLWASLAQFGDILGFLPSLLILLIAGPRSARVKDAAREALNFSITVLIAWVALYIVGAILGGIGRALPSGIDLLFFGLAFLVGLAQFLLWVAVVVLSIIAGVRVNGGGSFRYPFTLRLVK